jgi:hypothetical protein
VAVLKNEGGHFFISLSNPILLDKQPAPDYPHLAKRAPSSIGPDTSDSLHLERGKMTRITKFLLIVGLAFGAACVTPPSPSTTAFAAFQPGYGGGGARVTCSSNDGRRNWCDIGRARDAQLVRQISGSACIRDRTWGVDGRGLWVDQGCRAEFAIGGRGGPPPPPPAQIVTCSSNDGRRNWCDIGRSRDVRLTRQISGSACIQGQTWGTDRRGIWVDRGCRAEFRVR